jgi:hypothetical protein
MVEGGGMSTKAVVNRDHVNQRPSSPGKPAMMDRRHAIA